MPDEGPLGPPEKNRSDRMPTVRIDMFEGRTLQQKRDLVREVTDAVCSALGVGAEAVRIQITETQRENSARAGVLVSEQERS